MKSGYEKAKTYYHNDETQEKNKQKNPLFDDSDSSDLENEDTTDEIISNMNFPEVLIKLSTNGYICRIWVIKDGVKTKITGKISSYKHVNDVIHTWFNYEEKEKKWKWYPTTELYTSYRSCTPRILSPIDYVVFKNTPDGYQPYPYHPLI